MTRLRQTAADMKLGATFAEREQEAQVARQFALVFAIASLMLAATLGLVGRASNAVCAGGAPRWSTRSPAAAARRARCTRRRRS